MLNLPHCNVVESIECGTKLIINVESFDPPEQCPHCSGAEFVGYGYCEEPIRDLPRLGKHTTIKLKRRRYRCRRCLRTFLALAPFRDKKRKMTSRLVSYIEQEAENRTLVSVANEVGISETTVRKIVADRKRR